MAILTSRPRIHNLSGDESRMLDSAFGSSYPDDDFDLEMTGASSDGFAPAKNDSKKISKGGASGKSFMDTKMVPFTITTDGNTATQVMMLLEMVRYCMENSKEVLDSTTGEPKEYSISLKVRNRGKSSFIVSIGDESMPPIPVPEDVFFIGS